VSLCDHCASGRLVFQYRSVLYFTSVISKLHYAVLLLSRVVCLSIRTGRLTYYTLHRCSLLENYFKAWRFLPITADYLVARCPHLWCRFIPVLCCGYSIIYGSICTSQLQNSRFDSTFVLASLQHSSRILHTLETAFTVSNFGQHTHTHTQYYAFTKVVSQSVLNLLFCKKETKVSGAMEGSSTSDAKLLRIKESSCPTLVFCS
jgi:hypothetical protein